MGFLDEGSAFEWKDAKNHAEYIREHGIIQFLNIYDKIKDKSNDCLKWGDEIEYTILQQDPETKNLKLSLRGPEIIDILAKPEHDYPDQLQDSLWRPEYGRHMVEGTPGGPYTGRAQDFTEVEKNMILRRKKLQGQLKEDESVITLTNFPLLGVGKFTVPGFEPNGETAKSAFTPDEIIHPHFRFRTLTKNIRERRGSNVNIEVPLFKDKNTAEFTQGSEKPGIIYCDSMAFGMGCSCLQCTFQCCNLFEARHFYDQLAVLCPILLALTASAPIIRGYLADTDCRWDIISASVDDRTREERGEIPLKENPRVVKKSRYGSISSYISNAPPFRDEYNDLNPEFDEGIFENLKKSGIDDLLAKHFAHLFIRDPLVIYTDKVEIDDETHADHFENIQSTNWQTVRFKPPPPNSDIGWRVEFRPMEVQLTDFENAAFVIFIVLITRVMRSFEINFYEPLSKVDENMDRAHKKDAILNEKFWWRKDITKDGNDSNEYIQLTVNEIVNGNGEESPGLIQLIKTYLDSISLSLEIRTEVNRYLDFISGRCSGKLLTSAAYMRKFVVNHPKYNNDSIVTEEINNDLMDNLLKISNADLRPKELFGTI